MAGLEARRDDLDIAVEQRAELARVLAGVAWPATARQLAANAVDRDADADLVQRLAALPARRRYGAVGPVWSALGGTDVDEAARTPPAPPEPVHPGREPDGLDDEVAEPVATPRSLPARRFRFAFAPLFVPFALPFGVTPMTAWVDVGAERFEIRFGPWVLRTDRANVAGAEVAGPYALPKVLGPPHLSLSDRGITFATNRRAGVCIRFHEPVRAFPLLRHPGVTVTVDDLPGLVAALAG